MGQRSSSSGPQYACIEDKVIRTGTVLPLDIVLMIIELLDHEALCNISLLSKHTNALVNRRLWGKLHPLLFHPLEELGKKRINIAKLQP